jgi:hypothetical protein
MTTILFGVIKLIFLCVFGFAIGKAEAINRNVPVFTPGVSVHIHYEAIAAILILFVLSLLIVRAKSNENLGIQFGLYIFQVLSLWSAYYVGLTTYYHPEDMHLLDTAIISTAALSFVSALIGSIITVVIYNRRKRSGQQ